MNTHGTSPVFNSQQTSCGRDTTVFRVAHKKSNTRALRR